MFKTLDPILHTIPSPRANEIHLNRHNNCVFLRTLGLNSIIGRVFLVAEELELKGLSDLKNNWKAFR